MHKNMKHAATGQVLQLTFRNNRMEKRDLCDFNHDIVVGITVDGLIVYTELKFRLNSGKMVKY